MKHLIHILLIAICSVSTSYAAQEFAQTDEEINNLVEKKPEMTKLVLGGEGITDKGMRYLLKLQQLRELRLTGTSVSDKGLKSIEHMSKLERLGLNTFHITDKGLLHLKKLNSLMALDLESTKVTDAGLEYLSHLRKLTHLSVGYTKITGEGIGALVQLQQLRLVGPQVTDKGLTELGKLPELRELQIGGENITGNGLAFLKYLKKLRSLSLSGNKLTSSDLIHLQALSELTSLDFHHVTVTDAGVNYLKTLRNLNRIGFRSAEVTESAIIALKKAIPNLGVSNVEPTIVDVFDKDGKVIDMNSSFFLMLSNTSSGFDDKDVKAIGGRSLNLEKQVVVLINDKKIASYTGGGILVPLNHHFQNKTILAGENILTVKALPDVPLYLKIIESGANKQFRRFLVKEILKREDAKIERSFPFRVITTMGKR